MKDIKKILENKPKVEDYDFQPYGYINALLNYIDKIEEQLRIGGVVVSEACKCDKPLPYELMPFKCHNCSGEIKKSETEFCEHPIYERRRLGENLQQCLICEKVIDKQN